MPSFTPRVHGLDTVVPAQPQASAQQGPAAGRDTAWLRIWTTVLGLAFLTGQPVPAPPPAVRAATLYQPYRTDRLVASLSERMATDRGAALRGYYSPAVLARALTGTGRRLLANQPVPPLAGQVWVIPQLRWIYEAVRVGWNRDGISPEDLAPPLDFAIAGLPDWPGILVGQRLTLLLRHPLAPAEPANRALVATALFGAEGKAAFKGALAADLSQVFPRGGTDKLAEAMRLMDCPRDWLITFLR
jgi:hypothetical protein